MSDGAANYIGYGLYKDSGYTTYWSDAGYDSTFPYGTYVADVGIGGPEAHTVYGELWGGANAPVGAYTDVVNVTVYY